MSVALEPRGSRNGSSAGKSTGRLFGCSGLPSILVGRPSLLRTRIGVAAPKSGAAVAKKSDLPGMCSSRWLKHATTQTHQRQRSAHQLHKRATLERIGPTFRLLRKLTSNKVAEHWRVSQLVQTAPVLFPWARSFLILQRQDVVAHEFEIYVTIAIAHVQR